MCTDGVTNHSKADCHGDCDDGDFKRCSNGPTYADNVDGDVHEAVDLDVRHHLASDHVASNNNFDLDSIRSGY